MHFGYIHILLGLAFLFWLLALIPATSNSFFMPAAIFMIILYLIIGGARPTP